MALSFWPRQSGITLIGLLWVVCGWLQGCSTPPRPAPAAILTPHPPAEQAGTASTGLPLHASSARDPSEYRQHAAQHLYTQHAQQIFAGPLPPLLQAVGVVDLEIGSQGEVRSLRWLRAPTHVPDVMRQIEQLIHRAAPYPAPVHLQRVTYTDTWLWHQSGRFQLHTLSEGQLGAIEPNTSTEPARRAARRPHPASNSTKTAKCSQPSPPAGGAVAYC
jgi:hypothetical protein